MASILPKEETIIDPLYEPLKLNRYELCDHLQRLKDISHLRYGFSPYLLFDVEGMKEVIETISLLDIENGEINGFDENYEEFIEKFTEYLNLLEKYVQWSGRSSTEEDDDNILYDEEGSLLLCKENEYKNNDKKSLNIRNEIYWELRSRKEEILKCYQEKVKNKYWEIFRKVLYHPNHPNGFNEQKYKKISHLFRLNCPVKVKCPKCTEEQFMCEEGKIYSMKEALLRTFELRRARWLQMSGSLHIVHRAATHTRLSHEIGSMIVGVNALREIDVYPVGDMLMSLGEYLLMRGELHEFLMANFLHDIGHSPLSHVLEPNPFIELDHEEITRNLIRGEKIEGDGESKMDWYVTERYLLKLKAIKDFEYRFFENQHDPLYDVDGTREWTEDTRINNFLDCLGKNDEMLESEIVTVSEVLENFGVDKERVVEILSGHEAVETENENTYDTQFLNKLIESKIDIDRMDHVKRDSVVCGLSLTSFRLLELLGSMSVVLPGSKAYEDIRNVENDKPYILISENGLLYVMDLLTARRSIFKDVLYSDENNWINGVVNQITALTVRYLPHIKIMLPFITDQILMHFYMDDLFLGTQIEKLNKLFHGKVDYSAYGKPMRYKLKDGVIITKADLERMYKTIERINDDFKYSELPSVVFYTNIKPTKCPACGKRELKRTKGEVFECSNCESKITVEPVDDETGQSKWKIEMPPNEENSYSIALGKVRGSYQIKNVETQQRGDKNITIITVGSVEETWDDMLIYGKKFKKSSEEGYYPFQKLAVNKCKGVTRDMFPDMPCELDVANLFYVWVNDFALTEEKDREEWIINKKIHPNWVHEFYDVFVDLNKMR